MKRIVKGFSAVAPSFRDVMSGDEIPKIGDKYVVKTLTFTMVGPGIQRIEAVLELIAADEAENK